MTQPYYFVCSIGPVQDFIQTARTSQDLWFGSWLLSELSKAAAKALQGHELIFPAPKEPKDLAPRSEMDVTNKVVAIISGDPKTLGEAVEKAVKTRLMELAKDSFNEAKRKGQFDRDLAEKQVAALTEFYWAAAPYHEIDGDNAYAKARARAEALLNARKNTRDFGQAHGVAGLPKSSLDGWRESVLPIHKKDAPYWMFKADKGEALSGIDLMKRWGERSGETFISTTDVAAIPFIKALDARIGKAKRMEFQEKAAALLAEYSDSGETPGTMFYLDRLAQLVEDDKRPEDFRAAYAELRGKYDIKGEPSPYYALLLADGDNMGKTIDALTDKSQHSALSQALSAFAPEAKAIIKDHHGVPVYVGGDDVLAYLPVHTAIDCIRELDQAFSKALQGFHYEGDKSPTLSVGLAIAHHLTPLSDALEQARSAEKEAKKIDGKNALLISMSKRGGSERTAKGKLDKLVERMSELVKLRQDKALSHGAAYELEDLHKRLDVREAKEEEKQTIQQMLKTEAERIINRKRESGGKEEASEKTRKQIRDLIGSVELAELAREIILASEFAAVTPEKEKQP
jgi:CRISPR-associated protein Cmr2